MYATFCHCYKQRVFDHEGWTVGVAALWGGIH